MIQSTRSPDLAIQSPRSPDLAIQSPRSPDYSPLFPPSSPSSTPNNDDESLDRTLRRSVDAEDTASSGRGPAFSTWTRDEVRNVRFETESGIAFSLPVEIGQSGALLRSFWLDDGSITERGATIPVSSLESYVYRKTRFGAFVWRVGTCRGIEINHGAFDRLKVLRAMTRVYDRNDSTTTVTALSQLKGCLITGKSVRYEDSMSVADNMRYPLIIEDRLSVEWYPLPAILQRDLLDTEADCSDNNLGLTFEHRLSRFVEVCSFCRAISSFLDARTLRARSWCCDCRDDALSPTLGHLTVRISLRSSLNEYHEIAYWYELECEIDDDRGVDRPVSRDTRDQRDRRHDALASVFARLCLPVLTRAWPMGMLRESLFVEPTEHILTDQRIPVSVTSGSSYGSHEKMFDALVNRAIESTPSRTSSPSSVSARLKFDGSSTYVWYAMGEFSNDGRPIGLSKRLNSVLGGSYVYQAETISQRSSDGVVGADDNDDDDRSVAILTEVAFLIDHKVAFAHSNAGGALARQIEVTCYGGSTEQRVPDTAYVLKSTDTSGIFWHRFAKDIMSSALRADETIRSFVETCASLDASYVANATIVERSSPFRHGVTDDPSRGNNDPTIGGGCSRGGNVGSGANTRAIIAASRLMDDYVDWCRRNGFGFAMLTSLRRLGIVVETADATVVASPSATDEERSLLPLTPRFSAHFMRRLHDDVAVVTGDSASHAINDVNDDDVATESLGRRRDTISRSRLLIARTYDLPRDFGDLLFDYERCHRASSNHDETMLRVDGLLIGTRFERCDGGDRIRGCRYEKFKLNQTIEVFVTKNGKHLFAADSQAFSAHRIKSIVGESRYIDDDDDDGTVVDRSVWSISTTAIVDTIGGLIVTNMPVPPATSSTGDIAELMVLPTRIDRRRRVDSRPDIGTNAHVRFVKWRLDKSVADRSDKILAILSSAPSR